MNTQTLENLVSRLGDGIRDSNSGEVDASLTGLEFFAYGAEGVPQTDLVSRYILSRVREIRSSWGKEEIGRAREGIGKLTGYVNRLIQEPLQHTSNGNVRDAAKDLVNLVYVPDQKVVKVGSMEVHLSGDEDKLMAFFWKYPKVVHSQEDINKGSWDGRKSNKATFGYTMNELMHKIQPGINSPQYILRVRGRGYIFSPDSNEFNYPMIKYDPNRGLVTFVRTGGEVNITLKGKQKNLMDFLYSRRNKIRSIKDITRVIWGGDTPPRYPVVRSTIYSLKDKLTIDPNTLPPIIGTPDQGYMLRV